MDKETIWLIMTHLAAIYAGMVLGSWATGRWVRQHYKNIINGIAVGWWTAQDYADLEFRKRS